MFAIIDVKET